MSILPYIFASFSTSLPLIFSAAIAVFLSFTSPLVMIHVNNRQLREDREAEWEHQDFLAKQSKEGQAALSDKVDVIHRFVNNDQTAGIRRDLDSAEERLVMLQEIYDLHSKLSDKPDGAALGVMQATVGRIAKLKIELAERERQTQIVEQQIRDNPGAEIGGGP